MYDLSCAGNWCESHDRVNILDILNFCSSPFVSSPSVQWWWWSEEKPAVGGRGERRKEALIEWCKGGERSRRTNVGEDSFLFFFSFSFSLFFSLSAAPFLRSLLPLRFSK